MSGEPKADEGLRRAQEYIRQIRDEATREYAERYLEWIRFEYGPPPALGAVSKVSALRVRTQIHEQLRG